ncbi:MAG: DUF3037 domain-containing protein [Muribaculaceae bacterium]|nr:DUF3037 domain-containing protein [Muribaculaceae bacterium]
MHDEHLYEYAVLRYVPRAEREEFVNIGLAMMCKRLKWLRLEVRLDPRRLDALGSTPGIEALSRQLKAFQDIAAGVPEAGPIAECPVEERFRWLTAEKSACIRTSPVHPGLTTDLDNTFRHIFAEQVE